MDLMSRFAACPPFTTLSGHHCGSCGSKGTSCHTCLDARLATVLR